MLLHIPNSLVQIHKYPYLKGIMNIQYPIGFSHDDFSILISIDKVYLLTYILDRILITQVVSTLYQSDIMFKGAVQYSPQFK